MKKPVKPTPPHEPVVAPTRTYDDTWEGSLFIYDESLSAIIGRVRQQVVNWQGMRPDCVFGVPTLDEIKIELEHEHDDANVVAKWAQKVTVTMTDAEWATAQTRYAKSVKEYEGRMAAYQVKLVQYEKDLDAYEVERARAAETRDRETLTRLASKYWTDKP